MQDVESTGIGSHGASIIISGDHLLIRAALRLLVESEPGLTVAGDCESRPEALSAALATEADLILLDFDLCDRLEGVPEQIEALLRAANGTPVLILTATDDCQAAHAALEHGAIGFVMKDRPPEVLYRAIRAGIAGEAWLERSSFAAVFRSVPVIALGHGNGNGDGKGDGARRQLTRRELEIVDLVVLGISNKAVAERLFIAESTVRHHLTTIFEKLKVANRFELMRRVFRGPRLVQRAAAVVY
jgi:DNA-binding NarL/FixJ family response regulator